MDSKPLKFVMIFLELRQLSYITTMMSQGVHYSQGAVSSAIAQSLPTNYRLSFLITDMLVMAKKYIKNACYIRWQRHGVSITEIKKFTFWAI